LVGALVVLIVVIVHALGTLFGVLVSLMAVIGVHALGLGELVDFTANEASEKFFGKGVGDWVAYRYVRSCRVEYRTMTLLVREGRKVPTNSGMFFNHEQREEGDYVPSLR